MKGLDYSLPADVYSYGAMVLEMFTRTPLYNTKDFDEPWSKIIKIITYFISFSFNLFIEISEFVVSGNHLPIPNTIPPEIRNLVMKCWESPEKRPSKKGYLFIFLIFCRLKFLILFYFSSFQRNSGVPEQHRRSILKKEAPPPPLTQPLQAPSPRL